MKIIQNEAMPKSNGHYSMCIEHNGLLYISGQLPFNPKDRTMPKGIEAQTLQTLQNLEVILVAAGSQKDKVIQMRIYVSDIELWPTVNKVYADFFDKHKPVRAVIPTGKLHYGALIEIEGIATL